MATKTDLLNMAIKKGNVVGVLNLCMQNEKFVDICENNDRIKNQILKFFVDVTGNDEQLIEVLKHILFRHKMTNEQGIIKIMTFMNNVIGVVAASTKQLKDMVDLIRDIETRKQGGWIYVNYKPEKEGKLYTLSGPAERTQLNTNDEGLVRMIFEQYFNVSSDYQSQQIYQI